MQRVPQRRQYRHQFGHAHLLDMGFISFDDDGTFIVSLHLPPDVIESWSIAAPVVFKILTPQQQGYIGHHQRIQRHTLTTQHVCQGRLIVTGGQ